jgi:hypothetical protein
VQGEPKNSNCTFAFFGENFQFFFQKSTIRGIFMQESDFSHENNPYKMIFEKKNFENFSQKTQKYGFFGSLCTWNYKFFVVILELKQ